MIAGLGILDGHYTLVGSLPPLPSLDRAERLPITRQRLRQRFATLPSGFRAALEQVADLLVPERAVRFSSDAELVRRYHEVLADLDHPELRRFVTDWMEVRTVLSALRRQHRDEPAPTRADVWGVDPRARWIERHWDRPDFALGAVCPWISEAREHLAAGRAIELQALEAGLVWRSLEGLSHTDPFGFGAVFAYAVRWHLLNGRLAQDALQARERFVALVEEVTHELELDIA